MVLLPFVACPVQVNILCRGYVIHIQISIYSAPNFPHKGDSAYKSSIPEREAIYDILAPGLEAFWRPRLDKDVEFLTSRLQGATFASSEFGIINFRNRQQKTE